jgi:hypothetical protein
MWLKPVVDQQGIFKLKVVKPDAMFEAGSTKHSEVPN